MLSRPSLPLRRTLFTRTLPALLALGAAVAVQAQTLVRALPPPIQIVRAAYYEAHDLGEVAEGRPMGCIAPNGMVGLTRSRYESGFGTHARAVIAGSPDFLLFYFRGIDSWVTGCNSQRELVGTSAGGVIWDIDWTTGPQRLPSSFSGGAEPLAINDARQVVGRIAGDEPFSFYWAMLWTTSPVPGNAALTAQRLFPGEARAINNLGQIAATRADPGAPTRAVLVENGGAAITPVPWTAASSWAGGIDAQGRLVGGQRDAAGQIRGFSWHRAEGVVPLAPSSLGSRRLQHSEARAIGADRMIAGRSFDLVNGQPSDSRATVWPQAGSPRNLNHEATMPNGAALGLTLTDVIGVADNGALLCEGRTAANGRRAVLLTPRPGGSWSGLLIARAG